ncbi:MAG: hypothetical protein CMB61_00660 [Euryarchaeota archaeon]|nr:hypothetical protein [Euryarchaeota archaeon]
MVLQLVVLLRWIGMEPNKSEKTEHNRQKVTMSVIALAFASLLAGASVAATLEEYAAPVYAEADPFEGAVDDLTGEDTWEEKEADAKPMSKQIRKAMKSRMDDRMDDRTEHLEKRIEIDSNLIIAFQYCLDSTDCAADNETLLEMIEKITWAVDGMQAKINGSETLTHEDWTVKADDERFCLREENGVYLYDCDDKKYKDWDERKDWNETDKVEFAEEKETELMTAQVAISFCLDFSECIADSETIETALERMISRADHHSDCAEDGRCDRDHDNRKGFRGRIGGAICKMMDSCEDRERTLPAQHTIDITQELCESRMGVWTEAVDRDDGVFYCDWSELEEESDTDESSEEDDREDDQETSQNQEECEANGGTWYEDRQYCQTE